MGASLESAETASDRWLLLTRVALVLMQLLALLTLAPWLVLAGLSLMAFDAPGSMRKLWPWLYVGGIGSYPLVVIACGAAAWWCQARRRLVCAVLLALVPLVIAGAAAGFLLASLNRARAAAGYP